MFQHKKRALIAILFVGLVVVLPTISASPLESSPSSDQVLNFPYFIHPLGQRYVIESHFDSTAPDYSDTDGTIRIYTSQDVVRNGACNGTDCHCETPPHSVCAYYDNETSPIVDPMWDQGHSGLATAGPGWLWYNGHPGYDLGAAVGTPVYAMQAGLVSEASDCTITINHGGGYQSRYLHLQTMYVQVNDQVTLGQRIALSGDCGAANNPHLHYEIRLNQAYVDPWSQAANLWAGDNPFPLGYRDQNKATHGPLPLDNPLIRDAWTLSADILGSPISNDCTITTCPPSDATPTCSIPPLGEDPAEESASPQITGVRQNFERGYIYQCSNSDTPVAVPYGSQVYLPRILATDTATGWNSFVYVRNLSTSPAKVSITFYEAEGRILESRTYQGLPSNGTWQIDVKDILSDPANNGNSDFINRSQYDLVFVGSAVVASDQDIAVIARAENNNNVTAYAGISDRNDNSGWGHPGTTIYAPTIMWRAWEGAEWKTYLYVQNTTNQQANFTLSYCWQDAPTICFNDYSPMTLPPFGSRVYDLNDEVGDGGRFYGFARIYGSNQQLAAVVTQIEPNSGASDYNTFIQGSSVVFIPSLMRDWYGWNSSFTVQNVGDTNSTVVTIEYRDDTTGETTFKNLPILQPGASLVITQFDTQYGVPYPNWHGTAKLTRNSQTPIVAIINQERTETNHHSHQSYSSFRVGGSILYAPFVGNSGVVGNYRYTSGIDVQNIGSVSTYVARSYCPAGGGTCYSPATRLIEAGRVFNFYVPVEGIPLPFLGSLKVTRDPAVNLTGIHNFMRWDANSNPVGMDYGASYNLLFR